ncbi:unnamed protein product [Ilex paraguariensis]|uniref:Uncharacterized protein n=1 Tax=Ilex paraguariensis TaxID=185542 RepID=A0ABC8S450_9AQUA
MTIGSKACQSHKLNIKKDSDRARHANNGVICSHKNGVMDHFDIDLGLRIDDSFVEDSMNANEAEETSNSHHLEFSYSIVLEAAGNNPFLFDAEDHGRVLNLVFDDQCDAEYYRNAKVNLTELMSSEANNLDKISNVGHETQYMVKCETPFDGLISDIEESRFDLTLGYFVYSTNKWQPYAKEYQQVKSFPNEICLSQRDSGDDFRPESMTLVLIDNDKEAIRVRNNDKVVIAATMFQPDPHIKDYILANSYGKIVDVICEDSNAQRHNASVGGSEDAIASYANSI